MNEQQEKRLKILVDEVKNLQEIIKRMASNSFEIKKWTITLIVATFLFKGDPNQIYIAFIPLIAFWYLDSYYLRQERLFRKKYDDLIKTRIDNDKDFFNVNSSKYEKDVESLVRTAFSVSIRTFYGSILVMLVMILILNNWDWVKKFFSYVTTYLPQI